MRLEKSGNRHGIGCLPVHAYRQGLAALQRQKGNLRRHDHAGGIHDETNGITLRFVAHDNRTTDRRIVSVEIFRGAVYDHIRAELQRPLVVWREESVIHGMRNTARARQI